MHYLSKQRNVCDGQSERVNLAEPLLVRERRHVHAQFIERRVYTAKITTPQQHYSFTLLNIYI